MDLAFTPEEQAFRDEVRAWVRSNLPPEISHKVHNPSIESGSPFRDTIGIGLPFAKIGKRANNIRMRSSSGVRRRHVLSSFIWLGKNVQG